MFFSHGIFIHPAACCQMHFGEKSSTQPLPPVTLTLSILSTNDRNIDNEVLRSLPAITVDSHSDLLIFVSVTCMSWISLNTKYQLIGTIVLSVMYYPQVHVVNILQTFQSVIMRSRWTHHTSKYWPSSWCRGELTRKLSWAAYFTNIKKPRQLHAGKQQKEVILYDQIYPSQSKESKQSTKMLLVCKALFLIFLPSICSFLS